jgi:hypothetical protein
VDWWVRKFNYGQNITRLAKPLVSRDDCRDLLAEMATRTWVPAFMTIAIGMNAGFPCEARDMFLHAVPYHLASMSSL